MIKIFRNIRHGLINEQKLGKYLLYAIGEIVLVVFGILIALQINNWNIKRIEREDELKSYQNIKRQVIEDSLELQKVIAYNNTRCAKYEYAVQIIVRNDRSKADTVGLIAMILSQYSDFHRSGNIYETLVNSGDIKLLKNTEITSTLQQLEMTYNFINNLEHLHWEIIINELSREFRGVMNYATLQVVKPEQLYAVELQNIFVEIIYLSKAKAEVYRKALNEIKSIIELIDEEFQLDGKQKSKLS